MSEPDEPAEDDPPEDFLSALKPGGAGPGGPRPDTGSREPPRDGGPSVDADAGLDPDLAILAGDAERPWRPPPPIIDTRPYQRRIGAFGLLLVLAFSIYLYARGGNGVPGVAPGQHLHRFVAPLAISTLSSVSANAHPVCNPARPARRGLNVCGRRPIVLAFFALGARQCVQQVDTLQTVSREFPRVQFAAIALNAGKAQTAAVVRRHHWTIQVAYDLTGTIGQVYGIEVCPLVEIARAGGVIQQRLIGEHWLNAHNLAGAVAKLERPAAG